MELDPRIKAGKKPLTCFDIEEAKKYVGKDCYFGSKFENFENLSKVPHATLHNVDDSPTPFQCYGEDGVLCYDCFILPCEWVKEEKKYRPFTGIEFAEKFDLWVGHIIRIRDRPENVEQEYTYKIIFSGYRWYKGLFEVFINGCWIDLLTLFELYEYMEDNEWHKFGAEE